MTIDRKKQLLTFIYLFAIYVAIILFPFKKVINNPYIDDIIPMILMLLLLGWSIFQYEKLKNKEEAEDKKLKWFLILPLIISCCSNIFCSLAFKAPINKNINGGVLVLDCVDTIIRATIEDVLFDCFLLDIFINVFLNNKNRDIYSILLTAGGFSLMHALNFLSGNYIDTLFQLLYTFILGTILCFIKLRSDFKHGSLLGHVLFNLLNLTLFDAIFDFTEEEMDYRYLIFTIVFALVTLIYVSLLYILYRRKNKNV